MVGKGVTRLTPIFYALCELRECAHSQHWLCHRAVMPVSGRVD
jgi:hypothetical protein